MENRLIPNQETSEQKPDLKQNTVMAGQPKLSLQEKMFAQQTPAQATFARKPTEKEIKQKTTIVELIEKAWWVLIVVFILIFLAFNLNNLKQFGDWLFTAKEALPDSSLTETQIKSQVVLPILTGTTYKVETDLGFLNQEVFKEINYYLAGKFTSGEYNGGQRIIALAEKNNGQKVKFVFVATEEGTIFLDGGKPNTQLWRETVESYYLLGEINKKEVNIQLVEQIVNDHPDFLTVNNDLVLYREELLTESGPYQNGGTAATALALTLNTDEYQIMTGTATANYPSLKVYGKVYSLEELQNQVAANWSADHLQIMDKYLNRGTKYIIVDQTGVPYVYELAYKDKYEAYQQKTLAEEIFALSTYSKELKQYTATEDFSIYAKDFANGTEVALPEGLPDLPMVGKDLPGFIYDSDAFEKMETSFKRYIPGFTVSCTHLVEAKILQNLSLEELEPVGKIFASQTIIYKLKDADHPLYHFLYDLKFKNTGLGEEEIVKQNYDLILSMKNYTRSELSAIERGQRTVQTPTFTEYVAKNPLLIVVNSLGDILAMSEGDFITHPECIVE